MATKKKALQAAAGAAGGEALAIEDVFSTYLYTGDGVSTSDYVINNGIDLQNEGGLVWIKRRDVAENHALTHTGQSLNVNGFYPYLQSQSTSASSSTDAYGINAFTDTGFTMRGRSGPTDNEFNSVNSKMTSWTFRKAPRFFDVVTYTGDGTSSQTISHNLDCEVGTLVIKRTDAGATASDNWYTYHRTMDFASTQYPLVALNSTNAAIWNKTLFGSTEPTSTEFYVGTLANTNGATYVAYLFAHDPLGPSGDGSDGLIACGSYTTDINEEATVDLGWEPQWVLFKRTDSATGGDWNLFDTMRGITADTTGDGAKLLEPNTSDAELATSRMAVTSTGFKVDNYGASRPYIYIAIRRGPMRQPTSGTEVFQPSLTASISPSGSVTYDTTYDVGFPPDFVIQRYPAGADGSYVGSRLAGNFKYMKFETTAAEATSGGVWWDSSVGAWNYSYPSYQATFFRRAPGFFDVVAYEGNSAPNRTVPHNLGVAPELMIIKNRTTTYGWAVYAAPVGASKFGLLNTSNAFSSVSASFYWQNTNPTSDVFTVGIQMAVNQAGSDHIAYLFASCPGVSKVGSYTGNGTSQTINCGFTSGARFVLIKRTDLGLTDWYVWDTARGIVAGNDPHLSLNSAAAEVTTDDSVDPDSSGFIVNQVAATNINVSSASYIYLAIA